MSKKRRKKPEIPVERRCDGCWHGKGGYGVVYKSVRATRTRYYICCRRIDSEGLVVKEGCGLDWSHKYQPSEVLPAVEVEVR